jgi:hypothetical protein
MLYQVMQKLRDHLGQAIAAFQAFPPMVGDGVLNGLANVDNAGSGLCRLLFCYVLLRERTDVYESLEIAFVRGWLCSCELVFTCLGC